MTTKLLRDRSRENWVVGENDSLSLEQINTGCLIRIADASEAMAKEHNRLIQENKWLSEQYRIRGEEIARLERQRGALRGTITRMKKKLSEASE